MWVVTYKHTYTQEINTSDRVSVPLEKDTHTSDCVCEDAPTVTVELRTHAHFIVEADDEQQVIPWIPCPGTLTWPCVVVCCCCCCCCELLPSPIGCTDVVETKYLREICLQDVKTLKLTSNTNKYSYILGGGEGSRGMRLHHSGSAQKCCQSFIKYGTLYMMCEV